MKKSWYIFFFQLPFLPERRHRAKRLRVHPADVPRGRRPREDIERYVDALRVPGVVRSALAYYRASVRRLVTGRVAEDAHINKPVLVVWGDKDSVLGQRDGRAARSVSSRTRASSHPGSMHWVQNDAADEVNELLVEFVTQPA